MGGRRKRWSTQGEVEECRRKWRTWSLWKDPKGNQRATLHIFGSCGGGEGWATPKLYARVPPREATSTAYSP